MSVKKNTGAILSEFKMLDISNSIMQLHNNIDLLASKVQDFAENKTAMVEFLVIFISIYELLDLDNNLVDKLDALLKNHKTLMNVFTEIFRMHKAFSITKIRQSTRKFIDEYYLSLMVAIEKNHNLITIVYNLYYGNGGGNLKLTNLIKT